MNISISNLLFLILGFLNFGELSALRSDEQVSLYPDLEPVPPPPVLLHFVGNYNVWVWKDNSGQKLLGVALEFNNTIPDDEFRRKNNEYATILYHVENFNVVVYVREGGSIIGVRTPNPSEFIEPDETTWFFYYNSRDFQVRHVRGRVIRIGIWPQNRGINGVPHIIYGNKFGVRFLMFAGRRHNILAADIDPTWRQ